MIIVNCFLKRIGSQLVFLSFFCTFFIGSDDNIGHEKSITPFYCRARINRDQERNIGVIGIDEAITCFLSMNKDIILDSEGGLTKGKNFIRLAPLIQKKEAEIIIYNLSDDDPIPEIVVFRPNAKRRALQLAINSLGGEYMPYLTGLLLGYSDEDIEFFIQRQEFYENSPKYLSRVDFLRLTDLFNKVPYNIWSKGDRELFDQFIQRSNLTEKVKKERENALNWLNSYAGYTTEELEKKFNRLKEENK